MEFAPELKTDLKIKSIQAHDFKIKCLDWNCTGTYLASGCKGGSVKIWNAQGSKQPVCSFSLSKTVLQVKWNPVDKNILACSIEKDTLHLLNIEQGDIILTVKLSGHPDHISWSPDGQFIAVMNNKGIVFIVEAASGKYTTVKNETCPNGNRSEICWGMDSNSLFVAAEENGMGCVEVILRTDEGMYVFDRSFICSMDELTTIDMDRKHHNLAVGSKDSLVTIIDCNEMITLSTLRSHKTGIECVRWTANGDYIAVCSSDNMISVLYPVAGENKVSFPISAYSTVFAFHPLKHLAAVVMGHSERSLTTIDIVPWKWVVCLPKQRNR